MRIKHLLLGVLAVAAAVACKPDEIEVTPALEVNKTAASVVAEGGDVTVEVTSNVDWTASADQDWVSINPASGKGSDKAVSVKITVDPNETEASRTAVVTVAADKLTKKVNITQAAKTTTPEPPVDEPEFEVKELYMLGSACDTGWSLDEMQAFANDGGIFTWTGNLNSEGEFRFPLQKVSNQWWPCLMISADGKSLVYGTSDDEKVIYNVPETGNYTITIDARDVKNMAVEVVYNGPVTEGPEVSWGLMGCFVDNLWATDVPMTKEGEWIVAKGAQFTELTFKIRGNASWNDKHNMGYAPGTEKGLVNARLAVVTAEYSKANLGGDCVDIKLNGEPGTYDVYFSFEKLEVYVMEQGYKPGEREPIQVEPQEVTYTVVGTIADHPWENNYEGGLMAADGEYLVAKNVPLVWNSTCYGGDYNRIEFKIVETGTWDGYAYPEKNVDQQANTEIQLSVGGENIALDAPEGNYDVYFDKANTKVWVMEPGLKPGGSAPADVDIDGKQWVFVWEEMYGVTALLDLGVTEPGAFYIAFDQSIFGESGWALLYSGTYTIEKGVLKITIIDPTVGELSADVPYTTPSDNEAIFDTSALEAALNTKSISAVASPEFIDIMGGGQEPEPELLADGDYWIVSSGKVATPLSSAGNLQTVDAVGGKSTASNAFNFRMIDEYDWLYVIKDSNGMYLYLDATGNFAASETVDYNDDSYCWQIYPMGDGTYYVANFHTMGTVQLNSDNAYVCVEDMVGSYPELIPAIDPIPEQGGDEPVTPQIPDNLVAYTIWEGTFESGSWGGMQDLAYGAYDWSARKPGQYLKITCAPTNAAADWVVSLRVGTDWEHITGIPQQFYNNMYEVVVELTQEIIDDLVARQGLIIQGDNVTVTKVELYREEINTGGDSDTIDNIVTNGGFEDGATGWMGWWSGYTQSVVSEGRNGGSAMLCVLSESSAQLWEAQLYWSLPSAEYLQVGTTYAYEYYVKSDSALTVQFLAQKPSDGYPAIYGPDTLKAGTDWTLITGEFTYDGNPDSIDRVGIQFGGVPGAKLWVDDFKFGPKK